MIELALNADGATGRNIAKSQNLPTAYLEQLMARLRNANLVTSIRGAKGKFVMARNPETVTLSEIVSALDGPIEIADCADVTYCCSEPGICALRRVFAGANNALHEHLEKTTLAELARQQQQESNCQIPDYSI
ncbi:MAG: Rrf2 family transcriptional regulator [Candidatus Hydrogenedentes bacterium]|nr:Rrf2 family transcriptional regulator [Candidatus Hydrogenedentota bacterium]